MTTRPEHDSLGTVDVPAEHLWGAQTQRSLAHFAISTERMPPELIRALVLIKRAAATTNARLGVLAGPIARAIVQAADEVLGGRWAEEFPLSVWQTGSGTQSNMNVNEVLANRASELMGGARGEGRVVHPNDHVNRSQSSNDVVPSAIHVAAVEGITRRLLPALDGLHDAIAAKAAEHADAIKVGRTHLQDATPVTLGQEFSGYVAQLGHARRHLVAALPHLGELALGGTAVGTGLNAPADFGVAMASELSALTGSTFRTAPNKFEALAASDAVVQAHGALRGLAASLMKIANDIRWLASGPRCGLGEISLPDNEPGSSIMPGKVNPTQAEALTMACAQVMGNDVAIGWGGASGQFELNVYRPLLAHALLQSIRLLADGMASFDRHCVQGIVAHRERMAAMLNQSLMLVTALTPHTGYERAAHIAQRAHREGLALREAALKEGVAEADYDAWVRPERMLGPSD